MKVHDFHTLGAECTNIERSKQAIRRLLSRLRAKGSYVLRQFVSRYGTRFDMTAYPLSLTEQKSKRGTRVRYFYEARAILLKYGSFENTVPVWFTEGLPGDFRHVFPWVRKGGRHIGTPIASPARTYDMPTALK